MDEMLRMLHLNFINAEDFVAQHKQIAYCEAIILPNGDISYIITSHQNCLLKLYMDKFEMNYETMLSVTQKYMSNFMEHLLGELKVVSVWYDFIMYANDLTEAQKETIDLLIKNKVVFNKLVYRKLNY